LINVKYIKPERIFLKSHNDLNEKWVQERIAEDPALLGLGDLILKDKERIHAQAGRLDLLLQDAESTRRYEVEIQLGKTDESHIIRTIEYWDIERKRYPQYDHTAVIIAEDITSRFLNVIGLFNGFIPLVAIQMQALMLDDQIMLVFTKVLDERRLGLVDEDEEVHESTDRVYWEQRSNKATVAMTDVLLEMVKALDPDLALKYNKFYIGLAKDGAPFNFVVFRPQKDSVRFEPRLEQSEAVQAKIDEAGLEVMDYDSKWGRYRIRLGKSDINKHEAILKELLTMAYKQAGA
jgi:hypothetical protein